MRLFGVTFLASALAACSSSPDFCTRFTPVLVAQENQIHACPATDAGITAPDFLDVVGGEFPFSVQGCEAQLPSCNANDLTELNHELACIQQLPAFDCTALDDEDAGLTNFTNSVEVCEPMDISVACKGGVDSGMGGCGMETHTVNVSENMPLPLGFQTPIPDCLGVQDIHYFSLTPPTMTGDGGDKAGGYYEIYFTNITSNVQGQLNVVLADRGGNPLHGASYAFSTASTIFLSTSPQATFLVEVSGDSQIALGYTISASYIPIDDPCKPDSVKSIAYPITLGIPTLGSYMWAGQNSADALITSINGDFDDWFEVLISMPGTYDIKLTGFPFDFAPAVDFVNGENGAVIEPIAGTGSSNSNTTGAPISYSAIAPTSSYYYLHVYPNQVDTTKFFPYSPNSSPLQTTAVLPSNYTQVYSLEISPDSSN